MSKPSRESSGRPPRRLLLESPQTSEGLSMERYLSGDAREIRPEQAAQILANELVNCFKHTVPGLRMRGKKDLSKVVTAWLKWREQELGIQFRDPYDPSLNQPSSVFLRQLEKAFKEIKWPS